MDSLQVLVSRQESAECPYTVSNQDHLLFKVRNVESEAEV